MYHYTQPSYSFFMHAICKVTDFPENWLQKENMGLNFYYFTIKEKIHHMLGV
jgi:hypothetical protein